MLDLDRLGFCSEIYVVEKTIEVVVTINGENRAIRIEALLDPRDSRYKTRAYLHEHVQLQAIYDGPRNINTQVWVDYNLPWTDRETADDAIDQALGFLGERCEH